MKEYIYMNRDLFPAIKSQNKYVFCDNTAGSQVPIHVTKIFNTFVEKCYVQPYGSHQLSKLTTKVITDIKYITDTILNNKTGQVVYGSSCTQLVYNLANAMESALVGNEIVIAIFNHEACITPFIRMAERMHMKISWWNLVNRYDICYQELLKKVNEKTALIVFPHVSNILGNILDVKHLVKKVKEINPLCKVFVDGVAYLPHGIIDVDDYNVDYYTISFYKFCGLRTSVLYIKDADSIKNQNHMLFDEEKSASKKMELGGIQFEIASGILGLCNYMYEIAVNANYFTNSEERVSSFSRKLYEFVMTKISKYEQQLVNKFMIKNPADVEIVESKQLPKVPIFSLRFKNHDENSVILILNALKLVCKNGTFYCERMFDSLGIDKTRGVVRISLMHYNTFTELSKIIDCVDQFKYKVAKFSHKFVQMDVSTIKKHFDNLTPDPYYTNKRGRAYSVLLKLQDSLFVVSEIPIKSVFYQSIVYNKATGNQIREYHNLDQALVRDRNFVKIINKFASIAECEYLQVHQIRVYASKDSTVPVVPEGIHQDGFNVVGIVCVHRENIKGGTSIVYDHNKEVVYTRELESGDIIILNDRTMYHNVTEIQLEDANKDGYRDVFVITTL